MKSALWMILSSLFFTVTSYGAPDPLSWKNSVPDQPEHILVQGATVWTSGKAGRLENADLLVHRGKIRRVGQGLKAPKGALVIDARGFHVTPGLIDAHSHSAIVGNLNESTNITTSEVRIEDVIDSEAQAIYRELAGGLTTANQLHGSANSIGGQNGVIKLRWGALPKDLLMEGAPSGIKFALGENPTRANGGGPTPRYPQTRPGVERSIRERFEAARDYREKVSTSETPADPATAPARQDLQLDALVEILDGERLVHAHSYRADEIVMLIRLAEDFGFRISSFQHVLEGYKVADEIAAHGAGASTFSDWWAYKYEVIHAIPYNGAIMHDRGVVVSFNSDDADLARRMNLEAAKAVRYGGVSEEEALKFVTLNPAIQLGIDDQVGSLEEGKDADFVIWSGHPLSTYTICQQTWIDGRKYFDREADLAAREALAAERAALMAKVKALDEAEKTEETEESQEADEDADETAAPPETAPPETALLENGKR